MNELLVKAVEKIVDRKLEDRPAPLTREEIVEIVRAEFEAALGGADEPAPRRAAAVESEGCRHKNKMKACKHCQARE